MNKSLSAIDHVILSLVGPPETEIFQPIYVCYCWKVDCFKQNFIKFDFLLNFSLFLCVLPQKRLIIMGLFKMWSLRYRFGETKRYKKIDKRWNFMWRVLCCTSFCYFCHHWKISQFEYYFYWTQLFCFQQSKLVWNNGNQKTKDPIRTSQRSNPSH